MPAAPSWLSFTWEMWSLLGSRVGDQSHMWLTSLASREEKPWAICTYSFWLEANAFTLALKLSSACFPGGNEELPDEESVCQWRRHGFDPWSRKIPWRRKWQPTPIFLPGEFQGQRNLAVYSPWGCKESDTTKWLNNKMWVLLWEA